MNTSTAAAAAAGAASAASAAGAACAASAVQQYGALCIKVASQLAAVVVLQHPMLAQMRRIALLHDELVLALVYGQALARGAVVQQLRVLMICPELKGQRMFS